METVTVWQKLAHSWLRPGTLPNVIAWFLYLHTWHAASESEGHFKLINSTAGLTFLGVLLAVIVGVLVKRTLRVKIGTTEISVSNGGAEVYEPKAVYDHYKRY